MRRPFTSAGQYLLMFSSVLMLPSRFRVMWRQAWGIVPEWYLTRRQRRQVTRAARWHLAGYAAIAAGTVALETWWPLICWLGPHVCMRWTYWLQGLGEHTGLTHRPNTLLNTRTLETNWFMRRVNWNMTYHTVHHTYPGVPFHALPRLHREVSAQYPHELPKSGYLRLHWGIIRSLARGRTEHDICAEADALLAQNAVASSP